MPNSHRLRRSLRLMDLLDFLIDPNNPYPLTRLMTDECWQRYISSCAMSEDDRGSPQPTKIRVTCNSLCEDIPKKDEVGSASLNNVGCYRCGAEDHIARNCPIKRELEREGCDGGKRTTPEELRYYDHWSMGIKAHPRRGGVEIPCPCGGGPHCFEYTEVNSSYENDGNCDDDGLDRWDSYDDMLNPEAM